MYIISKVIVITDSTCDLSPEILKQRKYGRSYQAYPECRIPHCGISSSVLLHEVRIQNHKGRHYGTEAGSCRADCHASEDI